MGFGDQRSRFAARSFGFIHGCCDGEGAAGMVAFAGERDLSREADACCGRVCPQLAQPNIVFVPAAGSDVAAVSARCSLTE
jgi:hypothetical protein